MNPPTTATASREKRMTSRYSRRNSDTTGDSTCGQGAEPRSNNVTFSWRLPEPPADHVLAVYGTLRPGRSNFDVVASIPGIWLSGTIRGTVGEHPAGRYRGFPAYRRELASGAAAVRVPVDVLVSEELQRHWDRLDAFEGPGYRRVVVAVALDDDGGRAPLRASVYESWPDGEPA